MILTPIFPGLTTRKTETGQVPQELMYSSIA